jgi:hypothetical protein
MQPDKFLPIWVCLKQNDIGAVWARPFRQTLFAGDCPKFAHGTENALAPARQGLKFVYWKLRALQT